MPDRWNDPRDERWRRDARYGQDRYGRDQRRDADEMPDYLTGPLEGRSFRDHEHDADWDGAYNQADYEDREYRGGQGSGRYERGPVFGERERGDDYSGAPARRTGGYAATPPYGGVRASGGPAYGRGGYEPEGREPAYRPAYGQGARGYGGGPGQEPRGQRPGQYADFGFGHDLGPGRHDERPAGPRRDDGRGFLDRAADRVASWFGAQEGDHRQVGAHGHRGKGPKGYRRSDPRISEDVHDALTDDPYLDATEVTVSVVSGEVTLSGVVADREAKHRAERIVERISGVDHVQNNLRIGHVQGSRPFEGSNPLTSPGRGFGDSVLEAQAKGENPRTSDSGDRKN